LYSTGSFLKLLFYIHFVLSFIFIPQTAKLEMAARFINSTISHLLLTGKAGTGKTTFLKQLASETHKSYLIVVPSGIAALNARGVTIHSQFLLPFGSIISEHEPAFSHRKRGRVATAAEVLQEYAFF
jgi:Cdc6-like AAA superfamily ATPase